MTFTVESNAYTSSQMKNSRETSSEEENGKEENESTRITKQGGRQHIAIYSSSSIENMHYR